MSHDAEITRLEEETASDQEIIDKLNEVYGPMGGQDPETAEFMREAAKRTFTRVFADETESEYEPLERG
jgi:hypothetical protein